MRTAESCATLTAEGYGAECLGPTTQAGALAPIQAPLTHNQCMSLHTPVGVQRIASRLLASPL